MSDKIIDVPGVGTVSFPDSMSDQDISAAIRKQLDPTQQKIAKIKAGLITQTQYPSAQERGLPTGADLRSPAQRLFAAVTDTTENSRYPVDYQAFTQAMTPGGPATEGMGFTEALKNSPAVTTVKNAWSEAKSMLPSTEHAGSLFDLVKSKAADVPIDTSTADDIVARAQELAKHGSSPPPKPIRDYIKFQTPVTAKFGGTPVTMSPDTMTYDVGHDFASNAGRLSTDELSRLAPQMKAQLTKFAIALKNADRDAAASVGMGDVYDAAIKEYRQAKSLENGVDVIKKWAIPALVTTALGAAGAKAYSLYEKATNPKP